MATGNDFGDGENTAPEGTLNSVPYTYDLLETADVAASVQADAGATLSW